MRQLRASVSAKDRIIESYEKKLAYKAENFSSFIEKKQNNPTTSSDISINYVGDFRASNGGDNDPNTSRSLMTELSDTETSRLNTTSGSSQYMEQTEIDYLKSIVYSYMMGTDPITMAKVIAAVLKFSDEEKRRIVENERVKQSWFAIGQRWNAAGLPSGEEINRTKRARPGSASWS